MVSPSLFHELLASVGAGVCSEALLAPAEGAALAPPNTKSCPLAPHTPYPAAFELKSLGVSERVPRSPPAAILPASTLPVEAPLPSSPPPRKIQVSGA